MNAAALAERLRNAQAQRAETVTAAGFVTLCPGDLAGKVTPKIDPLRGRNGVCDLVTAVTPFFAGVEVERTKSRPDQAANDAPMPAPATTPAPAGNPAAPTLTDWRQADADYLRHHWQCQSCCAAGMGRGQRCAAGADLWTTYTAAWSAAQPNTTTRRNGR